MINENILITIVVPVYKVEYDQLRRGLDSIHAQTSQNFEALLVDDGSPDDCGKICDEYAQKYENFRVIHQKNGGLSVVRNTGIDNARGQWVCFVDGDDWIESNTVELAEKYIAECSDGDILIWDEYYDVDDVSISNHFFGADAQTISFENEEKEQLLDRILPKPGAGNPFKTVVDLGTANARVYRTSFLREKKVYNKPGLKRMQDSVFNMWAYHKANKIYYRNMNLYHYSFNESAATQRYTKDIADTFQNLYESIEDFIRQTHNSEEYFQRLNLKFIRLLARMFELNYANPQNDLSLCDRLGLAKKDMYRPCFQKVVNCGNIDGEPAKIRLFYTLLHGEHYLAMFGLTRVIVATKKARLKNKKKSKR